MPYFEIGAVFFLVLVNGLLAMSELAMVSSRKSRLEHMANQGSRGARTALRLIGDPNRFLSTVQIGITLIGIVAGAFSGATLGQRLGAWLDSFPVFSMHGNSVGIGITVVATTYISLIAGELVPKRIALAKPERIASVVAAPMLWLSVAAAPAVWVLNVSTEKVLRLLGLKDVNETTVTEQEIKSLIAEGSRAGIFLPQEKEMIEGVLRLADRSIRMIMTPRNRIVWVDVNSGLEPVIDIVQSERFSRLLVCDGSIDRPMGFIHLKSLLPEAANCQSVRLSSIVTPALYVPDGTPVLTLLNRFKKERIHHAVVVDEYGSTEGIVTLTDVIEAIAGDLPERGEDAGPRIVKRDDDSWLADGAVPTDEVQSITGIPMGDSVQILAGFMLEHLRRIPEPGTSILYENSRFEVVDMDGNRIDKVLIQSGPKSGQTPV